MENGGVTEAVSAFAVYKNAKKVVSTSNKRKGKSQRNRNEKRAKLSSSFESNKKYLTTVNSNGLNKEKHKKHGKALPSKGAMKNKNESLVMLSSNGIKKKQTGQKQKRKHVVQINSVDKSDSYLQTSIGSSNSVKSKAKVTKKKKNHENKVRDKNNSDEEIPLLVPIDPADLYEDKKPTKVMKPSKISEKADSRDNPLSESEKIFSWLIHPLTLKTFFEKHWEQTPIALRRLRPKYNSHILSSKDLDTMLREHTLYYTKNVDVVSYENGVKQVFNQEGRAIPSSVWDFYQNGCSIRILNPQTYNQKVHLLIASLQEYFGTMVGANVYLTPPNSQGFAPHYDDIEAFIIQLEGHKQWKLYRPKESDVLARYSSPNLNHEDIGTPFMEYDLSAGDILYFPRGTIHEGRTCEDAHSLHITISVYQHTAYIDLLEQALPRALKRAAENDVEFRKGLPIDYLKSFGTGQKKSENRDCVNEKVVSLMQSLIKYIDTDHAADQLGRKFMHDSMPPVLTTDERLCSSNADGPRLVQGKVLQNVTFDLNTKVRLLRYYCVRLVLEDSSAKLYYNTENAKIYHGEEERWLELELCMVPAIQALQQAYPSYIEVETLPLEDILVKMQFISDLWECGIVVTEHPLESLDSDDDSGDSGSD